MRKLLIMLLMVFSGTSAHIFAQSVQECRQILSDYFDTRSREVPYDIDDIVVVEKIRYSDSVVSVGLLVNDHHRNVSEVVSEMFHKFREEFAPHEATLEIKNFLNTMITAGTKIEFVFLGRASDSVVRHIVSLERLKEIYSLMP